MKTVRRFLWLLTAFLLTWPPAGLRAARALVSAPSTAPATIDIPEGTPVTVHVFHLVGAVTNSDELVQVDRDVVVNGTVVVATGSIGLAHFGPAVQGTYQQDMGVVATNHSILGPHEVHGHGPKRKGAIGLVFSCQYVYSVSSTPLEVDAEPYVFDEAHHNGTIGEFGLEPNGDTEFTLKLKHALLQLPPAMP